MGAVKIDAHASPNAQFVHQRMLFMSSLVETALNFVHAASRGPYAGLMGRKYTVTPVTC